MHSSLYISIFKQQVVVVVVVMILMVGRFVQR